MNYKMLSIIHPFLFAAYPVLHLYSRNIAEATPADLLKPMIAAVALAGLLLIAFRVVIKDGLKAGIVATIALIMFFSYAAAIEPLRGLVLANYVVGRGLFLWPLWFLLLGLLVMLVTRTGRNLHGITRFASFFAIMLVAISVIQIAAYRAQPARAGTQIWKDYVIQSTSGVNALDPGSQERLPDIYYIILDEYARADVLDSYFNYDNSPFLDFLRSRGFYVANESDSNYGWTYPSLASSLNFDYLDALGRVSGTEVNTTGLYKDVVASLGPMIQDNRAINLLKNAAYTFVFFRSEFQVTHKNTNADITVARSSIGMNEFDRVFLGSTMLQPLWGQGWAGSYRDNIMYAFEQLGNVPEIDGLTFTFAHIMVPHAPYVFDAQGGRTQRSLFVRDVLTEEEYKRLYTGQLTYVNKSVETVVDEILTKSESPPVIIIQADHGIRQKELGTGASCKDKQFAILNAYYLPDGGEKHLYPSISPVNTFRVVFNHYFGANYPLLEDISY